MQTSSTFMLRRYASLRGRQRSPCHGCRWPLRLSTAALIPSLMPVHMGFASDSNQTHSYLLVFAQLDLGHRNPPKISTWCTRCSTSSVYGCFILEGNITVVPGKIASLLGLACRTCRTDPRQLVAPNDLVSTQFVHMYGDQHQQDNANILPSYLPSMFIGSACFRCFCHVSGLKAGACLSCIPATCRGCVCYTEKATKARHHQERTIKATNKPARLHPNIAGGPS